MSSKIEDDSFPIQLVIDKDIATSYNSGSTPTNKPWIQLQFWREAIVRLVEITNNKDCCGDTIFNLEIKVGNHEVDKNNPGGTVFDEDEELIINDLCGQYLSRSVLGSNVLVWCDQPRIGKIMTIQTLENNKAGLRIAEIDVYGTNSVVGKLRCWI